VFCLCCGSASFWCRSGSDFPYWCRTVSGSVSYHSLHLLEIRIFLYQYSQECRSACLILLVSAIGAIIFNILHRHMRTRDEPFTNCVRTREKLIFCKNCSNNELRSKVWLLVDMGLGRRTPDADPDPDPVKGRRPRIRTLNTGSCKLSCFKSIL
jgi:hypothetical protein